MKDKKIILLAIIFVLLVTVLGVSYAYFSAKIIGEGQENIVKAGTMELTFVDNNSINILNGKPGDSDSKTFTVENTGTIEEELKYNIKLTNLNVTFKKEDLKYTLVEYNDDTYETEKEEGINVTGFINEDTVNENSEMYLVLDIPAPKVKQKHYYKLTIEFQELEIDQNYNQGAIFEGKVNVDDNTNAKLYIPPKLFTDIVVADNINIFADDPDGNIRYVGANPNNYIWFNCDNYTKVTNETTAKEQSCEKWRIIGIMKDVEKENNSTEDLVKIVRDESIGKIAYSGDSNDWTNASLQKGLNGPYLVQSDTGTWITSNEYTSSQGDNTIYDNYKSITSPTLKMIESVIWHLGGAGYNDPLTAQSLYNLERGEEVPNNHSTIWPGKVGLIYPSDDGYATSGDGETSRDVCLETALDYSGWAKSPYNTDCAGNSWLKPSGGELWTITPRTDYIFVVRYDGSVSFLSSNQSSSSVNPSLYLKSNVKIAGEGGDGSEETPYILVP